MSIKTCPMCGGSGKRQYPGESYTFTTPCNACAGLGFVPEVPPIVQYVTTSDLTCPHCGKRIGDLVFPAPTPVGAQDKEASCETK
jgi:DnaJ-class molecular chaperone